MKILLVEDDPEISAAIREGLEDCGYDVDVVRDGERGLRVALNRHYGIIVLDIMLPGMDGLTICSRLRAARKTTPILLLTAKGRARDKVLGLETGADDYLAKPFDFDELIARVRALTRRDKVNKSSRTRIHDMVVDTTARTVARNGLEIILTPREFTLLEALVTRQGQVLTREVIQQLVWGDELSTSNIVDVHIRNLRKKLDRGFKRKLIDTVFGVGYTIRFTGAEPELDD